MVKELVDRNSQSKQNSVSSVTDSGLILVIKPMDLHMVLITCAGDFLAQLPAINGCDCGVQL